MIRSFADKETQRLFAAAEAASSLCLPEFAIRKLTQLDIVENLDDLKIPPGNRLEALLGDRKGQHSISINDQSVSVSVGNWMERIT